MLILVWCGFSDASIVSLLVVDLLSATELLLGLALDQHSLVAGDGLGSLGLWRVSVRWKGDATTVVELRTFRYSSEASCHSLVIVRGRMGLANRRVKENTAKAAAMTAEDRRKTLRPSSGGGGRRGPWGPKAI